jgi:hypothetical protein
MPKTKPKRITIDCLQPGWERRLEEHVQSGGEANLVHFDLQFDARFCVILAEAYSIEFRPSRDPAIKTEATMRNPNRFSFAFSTQNSLLVTHS